MKTEDTSATPGMTYYAESSGVYIKVTSPVAGSLPNYYELVFTASASPETGRTLVASCRLCAQALRRCGVPILVRHER